MNNQSQFEFSQDLEVVPFERGRAYVIFTKEWQYLKKKIIKIGDRPNLYLSLGLLFLGAAIPLFIQCIAGDFPDAKPAVISTKHVIWWASFAVCLIAGLLSFFFGKEQKGVQATRTSEVIEYMEQIEDRFKKDADSEIETQEQTIFYDNFIKFIGWSDYKNGTVVQSNQIKFRQGPCLMKDKNNEPNGGFKLLNYRIGLGLLFSGWIYRLPKSTGGQGNRLAIEDENFCGYGFSINLNHSGPSSARIEKRSAGKATLLGQTKTFEAMRNDWYRFKFFLLHESKFELVLLDTQGEELVKINGVSDRTYSSFDRVVVHGGYEYYVAELKVEQI